MKNLKRINDEFVNALGGGAETVAPAAERKMPAAEGILPDAFVETKEDSENEMPAVQAFSPVVREYISPETRRQIFGSGMEVGRFEGLNFARQVITVAKIAQLQALRESRAYRQAGFVNWENFCREVIHIDKDVIDENIRNFKKFGPEFLEAATRISMSRKVFRELRALPDAELKQMVSGTVVKIEGEEIPLDEEHGPEINAAIETLLAKRKGEADRIKEQNETAAKKMLEQETRINRQAKEIDKLKKTVEEIQGRGETFQEILERVMQVYGRTLAQLDQLYQAVQDIVDPGTRERLCAMMLPELERKLQGISGVICGYDVPEVEA